MKTEMPSCLNSKRLPTVGEIQILLKSFPAGQEFFSSAFVTCTCSQKIAKNFEEVYSDNRYIVFEIEKNSRLHRGNTMILNLIRYEQKHCISLLLSMFAWFCFNFPQAKFTMEPFITIENKSENFFSPKIRSRSLKFYRKFYQYL